jgi:precorrin-2 dehydrogenase/sirohydrochlorin ferrochelatase
MAKYPIYLENEWTQGRGYRGRTGRRQEGAVASGNRARVTVIAEHVQPTLEEAFHLPHVELVLSPYQKAYLVGATLVIAATNNTDMNRQIFADCQELEILCNVVDQPELCDFYVPALVRRGDLQIAVSTDGHCPAYAGHIRKKLEELFTDTHGLFVEALDHARRQAIEAIDDPNQRKAVMGRLAGDESFAYFVQHGSSEWHEHSRSLIADHADRPL